MKQDKGIKKVVIKTGRIGVTTGQKLYIWGGFWVIQVKHEDDFNYWYKEEDLQDYIS